MTLLWLIVVCGVLALIALDTFVLRRRGVRVSPAGSVAFGAFYMLVAMLLVFPVYLLYEQGVAHPWGDVSISGPEATLQYLACFIVEFVLSLDSAFVIAAIFAHLRVPARSQHKVLFMGIFVAMCVRGGLIAGTGYFMHQHHWVRFILAVVLLVAAIRMILVRKENLDPEKNFFVRVLRRFTPIAEQDASGDLIVVSKGRTLLTPLILPLILIETADAFLAFDSIPASYAFTKEPLLVFAGGCAAMLCVRSIIPALTTMLGRLRYFKLGMAVILAYAAVVIALKTTPMEAALRYAEIGRGWSLTTAGKLTFLSAAVVFGVVVAAVLGTSGTNQPVSDVSPLGEDADRVARTALATTRKVAVGVMGITGLALGAIMAVGPGPGIPVLLASLLLLATEFAIARKVVNKYRPAAERATIRAADQARKRVKPWLLVLIIVGTSVAATAVCIFTKVPPGLVIASAVPMIIGQLALGYLAYFHKPAP